MSIKFTKDNFRQGFELETQDFEDYNEAAERELDDNAYSQWLSERTDELLNEYGLSHLKSNAYYDDIVGMLIEIASDELQEDWLSEFDELIKKLKGENVLPGFEQDDESIEESAREAMPRVNYEDEPANWEEVCNHLFGGDEDPYLSEVYDVLEDNRQSRLARRIREPLMDEAQEEDIPDECYTEPEGSDIENVVDLVKRLSDKWTAEPDGTVSGPELQYGPGGIDELTEAVDELFRTYSLSVDIACSFHVHISHTGMHLEYDPAVQYFMLEYIHDNMDRVPSPVLQRWTRFNAGRRDSYFKPTVGNGRYHFIAFRGEDYPRKKVATWEFRCFGNVDNTDDARTCLALAIEAFRYAYRKVRRQVDRVVKLGDSYFSVQGNNFHKSIPAKAESILNKRSEGRMEIREKPLSKNPRRGRKCVR